MKNSLINWTQKSLSSCLFIGYFPKGSGTVASAVTIALLWLTKDKLPWLFSPQHFVTFWLVALALIVTSFFITSRSRELYGSDDSSKIVFDEVVGQFITFFMVPLSIKTLVLGFVLFRFFDIVKPFPVHSMEDMEGGVGVTMDDVVAGVMANATTLILLAVYGVIHHHLQ